jgi:hypothetical protein
LYFSFSGLALTRCAVVKQHMVSDGVLHHAWARDIVGELTVDAAVQFLHMWIAVNALPLGDGKDKFA